MNKWSKLLLISVILFVSRSSIAATNTTAKKHLNIYEVSVPPVLDGKGDDACWRNAAIADRFMVFKWNFPAKKQTNVKIVYDVKNIYFYITCEEENMDKTRAIIPQDFRDMQVFKDDSLEIALEPVEPPDNGKGPYHYQFAFNMLGTIFDKRFPSIDANLYNPTWRVKVVRGEKSWAAEVAIPFACLTRDGEYSGTPAQGKTWRINISRNENPDKEMSSWSFQQSGFNRRDGFGSITFMGLRNKKEPYLTVRNTGALKLGKSTLTFFIINPEKKFIQVDCILRLIDAAGKSISVVEKEFKLNDIEMTTAEIPYTVEACGELRFVLEAKSKHNLFSYGEIPFVTINVNNILEIARKAIVEANSHTEIISKDETARTLFQKTKTSFEKLTAIWEKRSNLDSAQWNELREKSLFLQKTARCLLTRISSAVMFDAAQTLLPASPVGISVVDSFTKVRPKDLFIKPTTSINLSAARNESESFQIVLKAGDKELKELTLRPAPLKIKNGKAVIPAENIDWGAVGQIMRCENGKTIYDPDPIMMGRPFNLEANELRSVWIDVHVPNYAPAGVYEGYCAVVLPGTKELPIKISLRVLDFTLPAKNSLRFENWFLMESYLKYYKIKDISLEQFEKLAKFFAKYRNPCFPTSWRWAPTKILIIEEPDGSLTFDFSELNKYLEISEKYGCRAGNIQFSFLMGWVQAMKGTFGVRPFTILNRETGVMRKFPERENVFRKMEYEDVAFSYLHRELMKALWKNVKDHGWDDMIYSEHEDEPNDSIRFARFQRLSILLRELCPDMEIMSFGAGPECRERVTLGYVNVFGSQFPKNIHEERMMRWRKSLGDKYFFYMCGPRIPAPNGYELPDCVASSTVLKNRIAPLVCWRYDADFLAIFASSHFPGALQEGHTRNIRTMKKYPEEKQFHMISPPQWSLGNGMYVWPAPGGELWPSIRLCALRDGLEDYEYVSELKRMLDRLAWLDGGNPLIKKYKPLLELSPTIVKSAGNWTHSPKELMEYRLHVSNAIEILNPVLKKLSPPLSGRPGEARGSLK